jgi:hypothetical protein
MKKEGRKRGWEEGRSREGRKGIGLVTGQQELRVSRITLFRASSGRCVYTQKHTHTKVCNAKVK